MKKIVLITFALLFVFTNTALAHTGLETSSPENGGFVTEELREIALTFEGKIEQGGTLEISDSNGQSFAVDDIIIENTQMTATLPNALVNGDYTVVWNIIGADGHPIQGDFSFTVLVPGLEKPAEIENDSQDVKQDVKQDGAPLEDVEDTKTNEQNQLPSYLIPVIVIVLVAIIVGIFVGLRKKNRK